MINIGDIKEEQDTNKITNQQCVDYILDILKEEGVKEKNIEIVGDITNTIEDNINIRFKVKNYTYFVFINGDCDDCYFGIYDINNFDISTDYLELKTESYPYRYIEDFYMNVVAENFYGHIEKIWKAFEKIEDDFDSDDVEEIVREYFKI